MRFLGVMLILLIILSLVGGGLFWYFYFEKPTHEDNQIITQNITIFASYEGEPVQTGYIIEIGDLNYSSGNTSIYGGILEKVLANRSVKIYNVNSFDQSYYLQEKEFYVNFSDIKRIDLELEKRGDLEIIHIGKPPEDIVLKLTTNTIFREPHFCVKWGPHIITINPGTNFTKIEPPEDLEKFNKCFKTTQNINPNMTINLDLKSFGQMNHLDYLEFSFFDSQMRSKVNYTIS